MFALCTIKFCENSYEGVEVSFVSFCINGINVVDSISMSPIFVCLYWVILVSLQNPWMSHYHDKLTLKFFTWTCSQAFRSKSHFIDSTLTALKFAELGSFIDRSIENRFLYYNFFTWKCSKVNIQLMNYLNRRNSRKRNFRDPKHFG